MNRVYTFWILIEDEENRRGEGVSEYENEERFEFGAKMKREE